MKYIFAILFLISFTNCSNESCEEITENFSSYKEAKNKIENAVFNFKDKVNTDKSSWIKQASFFSCNGVQGYFILETRQKSYIFKNLPLNVWNNFKNAASFGTYYSNYIRGKYSILLEK